MLPRNQRAQLHRILTRRFSRDELCTLCFDLNIPYEEFPASLSGLARELIVYCERRDRLGELIGAARQMRPNVDWGDLAPPEAPGRPASGVWRCPDDRRDARYVGSITSRKYHRPACGWVRRIARENRLCFADREAARASGYRPCRICEPPS
jgi:hypothetical protein